MKVLVCAYACNPCWGSEEAVGWNWVKAIARRNEVTVISAAFHEPDINKALKGPEQWVGSVRFIYVKHKPWHYRPSLMWRMIENSFLKPMMNWAYRLWQRDAFVLAMALSEEQPFDLIHQVTYVGYRFPGDLWRLEAPFVWGPLGGLENTPWSLLRAMDTGGMLYYAGRNFVNSIHRRFLRSPRRAIEAAGPGLIAATSSIRSELRRWYGAESTVICEVTAPDELAVEPSIRRDGDPMRLAWIGGHLPGKALPLLLEALSGLGDGVSWVLDVYGSGPKTQRWRARAEELGLNPSCRWHGQVPRDEAISGLAHAHLFVITSLKDLTSTVLLEALSQGLPVLCPNHCGFPDVVTPECGIVLPIDNPESFVRALAEAIEALYCDEARRRSLAAGALRRARDFSVDAKAEAIERVYAQVIAAHGRGRG